MDIFEQVKALELPERQYVVFGAGPLAAHGIRDTADVDLFVTTALYEELKASGWAEMGTRSSGLHLSSGIFETDETWVYGDYSPTVEELVEAADIIDDVPFAPLTEVLKWKRALGRPKDVQDVALIEQHLRMRS
ncbi:hypothetical protein [Umezawaea sp. Da 62-37]|uniref:hypothetical protein n=1 Tax=Umezawaea sp. Da 62-37 TaxID=3075927 RepID=UPI0028F6ED80|nr:hypothetical protein [Umezawaea sp. Da 62-37]WNV85034.1 hypothetical protein RM788_43960 [Umezawaea sp. Da 62-37]